MCHDVGALRDRREARGLQHAANGRATHAVADVLKAALNPRVPPCRILRGQPHDKRTDFEQAPSPSGFPRVRPFPADQPTMPPEQRVRRRDGGDLAQGGTTDSVRAYGYV